MNKIKLSAYAPVALRISIAAVYLWFGFQQLIDVTQWVGFIPPDILALSPVGAETLVYLNGVVEIVFGTALLFGFFTRVSAIILALHMADITFMVGYDAIGVRDFGIVMATVAIALFGSDTFSIDTYTRSRHQKNIEDQELPSKSLAPVQFSPSMVNTHDTNMVVDYIRREQKKGTPINNIRDSLFVKGWSAIDIDKAYKIVGQILEDPFPPQA